MSDFSLTEESARKLKRLLNQDKYQPPRRHHNTRPVDNSSSGSAVPLRWYNIAYEQSTANPDRAWAWSSASGIKVNYTLGDGNAQIDRLSAFSSSASEIQCVEAGAPGSEDQSLFFKEASTWLVIQNVVATVTNVPSGSPLWDWDAIPHVAAGSFLGYRSGLTNRKDFSVEFSTILKVSSGGSGGYKFCWRGKVDQLILAGGGVTDFDVAQVQGWIALIRIWTESDGDEGTGGIV